MDSKMTRIKVYILAHTPIFTQIIIIIINKNNTNITYNNHFLPDTSRPLAHVNSVEN